VAQTYTVILHGGPCGGETRQLTATQLQAARVICQGEVYTPEGAVVDSKGRYVYYWQGGGDTSGATKGVTHATAAWSRWMRVLAHKGPRSHNRIHKAAVRARRIARRR
jgi:hypothetical protein